MQNSTQVSLLEHFKEVLSAVEEKPPLWASLRRQKVDVFRLQYATGKSENSSDIAKRGVNVDFEYNEKIPQKLRNCLEEPEINKISEFENFTAVSESNFQERASTGHSQRPGERNREENRPKSQSEEKLSQRTPENIIIPTTNSCALPSKIAPLSSQKLSPVPKSEKKTMSLGKFLEETRKLTKSQKTELLYLTWRGLPGPDSLTTSDGSEFRFFVEKLLHPTLSPPFLSSKLVKQRNFWIGNIVTSRLHFDALDNLHVCFFGSKVVHLYSPWDTKYLYPEPWKKDGLNNWSSLPSILSADPKNHHLFFQRAKAYRAVIRAGEALYIPAGWWHEVFTLDLSFSVNSWFAPTKKASLRPTLMMLQSEKYHRFVRNRHSDDECDDADSDPRPGKKSKAR